MYTYNIYNNDICIHYKLYVKRIFISYDIRDLCFTNTKLVCDRTNTHISIKCLEFKKLDFFLSNMTSFFLLVIAIRL
jgi:hypothetical protein